MYLETPKEMKGKRDADEMNLRVLRALLKDEGLRRKDKGKAEGGGGRRNRKRAATPFSSFILYPSSFSPPSPLPPSAFRLSPREGRTMN